MSFKDLKIYCVNTQDYVPIDGGEQLIDVYDTMAKRIGIKPIAAIVNNRAEDLRYPVYAPKQVEFVDQTTPNGRRVYTHTLVTILYKAINDVLPGKRLVVNYAVSGGYYCTLKHEKEPVSAETVEAIKKRMREIVDADITLVRRERLTTDVVEMFRKQNQPDKVRLLESVQELYTVYYKLDDIIDCTFCPMAPSTGYIQVFDLQPYHGGMLLFGPDSKDVSKPAVKVQQEKLFNAFTDYQNFNNVIGVSDVGELNRAVRNKRDMGMLINVTEALHNRVFAKVAHEITERFHNGGARVVLIAGPSSSGKTTSSKRLAIQLVANYIIPKVISLDNYFVNRDQTPLDEYGKKDYESLYSLDLAQFNQDLSDLLAGKEVAMPTYNFETGKREYRGDTMKLNDNEILLMEGIHGLNPELTPSIPEEQKFRVFVSALTTLNVDDHNWIPSSDNRLLRRIVRDYKYRGTSAKDTIAMWSSVRRGEEKWIIPFQENADATVNSSLIFELAVMRDYAEPILKQVPQNVPEYSEARRLLRFLSYFSPLSENDVPSTSLLREFMGGSSFHY